MPEGGEGTVYFDKQIYLINHVSAEAMATGLTIPSESNISSSEVSTL
jgi:hypothetical protein